MHPTFVSPLGALVGLVALLPLAAAVLYERRAARVRRLLRLDAPGRGRRLAAQAALVAVAALLALAAAQPMISVDTASAARTDAEAYVVLDVSRSMLAARRAGAPDRFRRATDFALRFRAALPDVRFGVASLSNRVLAHLFPSSNSTAFAEVLTRALAVGRPPGDALAGSLGTSFQGLTNIATDSYFTRGTARRLIVLLSDDESTDADERIVQEVLSSSHIGFLPVRFGSSDERIYDTHGKVDEHYRPRLPSAVIAGLARASLTHQVMRENELGPTVAAARRYFGHGPRVAAGHNLRTIALGPYVVLAAALPLGFLLARRNFG
ncbi:MAG TPA: vWA domain-containing protein [Gaiellaceae bacterium]|jgi:hypothetical protein